MAQMALIIQLITTVWDQRHVCVIKRRRSHHLMMNLIIQALPLTKMAAKAALDVFVSLLVGKAAVVVRGEARGHWGAVELREVHHLAVENLEGFAREGWLVVKGLIRVETWHVGIGRRPVGVAAAAAVAHVCSHVVPSLVALLVARVRLLERSTHDPSFFLHKM